MQRGCTDRRGQLLLTGLETIDYRLRVSFGRTFPLPAALQQQLTVSPGVEPTEHQWEDGAFRLRLRGGLGASPRLSLGVDLAAQVFGGELIFAEVRGPTAALVKGFLALHPGEDNRVTGEAVLKPWSPPPETPGTSARRPRREPPVLLTLAFVPLDEISEEDRGLHYPGSPVAQQRLTHQSLN